MVPKQSSQSFVSKLNTQHGKWLILPLPSINKSNKSMKEKREEKVKGRSGRRGKEITSPGSSNDAANRVSRVLWALPRFHGGTFSQVEFLCSGIRLLTSHTNANENENAVHCPGSSWKWVRGLWGSLTALMPLYLSFPLLSPIPGLVQFCAVWSPWSSKWKLVPREMLSHLLTVPFSSSQFGHGSAFTPCSPGFYT